MGDGRLNVQFCGFGGQGIVLSGVILGTAAVTKANLNAIQTQSYGSEARGGECQAEVIVSRETIDSPLADEMNIVVAMSQSALAKYLHRLKSGGTLIIDPEFVSPPERTDVTTNEVPATQIADETGLKLAANMVMLGFLQQATGLFTEEHLLTTIRENVPERFIDANLEAARRGMALAKAGGVVVDF
jgi:2-oxoglutarate ferredoxin oxidoreductase subunit gamma